MKVPFYINQKVQTTFDLMFFGFFFNFLKIQYLLEIVSMTYITCIHVPNILP